MWRPPNTYKNTIIDDTAITPAVLTSPLNDNVSVLEKVYHARISCAFYSKLGQFYAGQAAKTVIKYYWDRWHSIYLRSGTGTILSLAHHTKAEPFTIFESCHRGAARLLPETTGVMGMAPDDTLSDHHSLWEFASFCAKGHDIACNASHCCINTRIKLRTVAPQN